MTCFGGWINSQRKITSKEHIAFDGKTVIGSGHNKHVEGLHLRSAMMVESGLTLYQCESQGKKMKSKH